MQTPATTPVEIVQELIAIHTTRKEASDKLQAPAGDEGMAAKLAAAAQQSDQFTRELMNELSSFGDAVQSEAGRENEYQTIYKNALADIETMSPGERGKTFQALEQSLKSFYQVLLKSEAELPVSLQELLTEQEGKL